MPHIQWCTAFLHGATLPDSTIVCLPQGQLLAAMPVDKFLQIVGSAMDYPGMRALLDSRTTMGACGGFTEGRVLTGTGVQPTWATCQETL